MSKKRDRNKAKLDVELMVFTNNPNSVQYNMLEMFYRGVFANTLGLMEARNKETGEIEVLLVGLDKEGDEVKTYPLAAVLKKDGGKIYEAPDGKGGYY